MRKPKPTKPTPIIVADELTPSDNVITSGTLPTTARLPRTTTTARLPPTPMNTSGVVSSPPEDLALELVTAARGPDELTARSVGIDTCADPGIFSLILIS